MEQSIKYVTTIGDSFETAASDILIQVLNHGTYHQAQIAQLLRQIGIEPITTDYITFVRNNTSSDTK